MNQVPPPRLPGFPPGSSSSPFASASPIKRVLAAIFGVALFAAAAAVGFMLFLVMLAIGAVVALILTVRVWWWRRKFARTATPGNSRDSRRSAPRDQRGDVFDGEYRVVDRNQD